MNRRHFLALTASAGAALTTRAAESAPSKFRVGVIGDSAHGKYGHSLDKIWLNLPDTEIAAVADPDAAGLASAQERLGGVRGFVDYRAMLAEVKPDIVAICLGDMRARQPIALAAIASGARGIYMEKPFCRTLAEADEIIAAADKAGVKFSLAHRNRYHPGIATIDRLLKEGAIGQLLELRGRGKEDVRGGCVDLWILGSHVLDLIQHFSGKPLACSATLMQDGRIAKREDVRDSGDAGLIAGNAVHARFEMERGVPAFFDSVQNAGSKEAGFGLELIGTRGVINLRMDSTPVAYLIPGNPFQPTKEPRPWIPITSAGVDVPEPIANLSAQSGGHLFAARELLAAVRENRAPVCDVHEGRVIVEMITAVLESHRRDGRRVAFPIQSPGNPLAHW